jgi:hypothetical protein
MFVGSIVLQARNIDKHHPVKKNINTPNIFQLIFITVNYILTINCYLISGLKGRNIPDRAESPGIQSITPPYQPVRLTQSFLFIYVTALQAYVSSFASDNPGLRPDLVYHALSAQQSRNHFINTNRHQNKNVTVKPHNAAPPIIPHAFLRYNALFPFSRISAASSTASGYRIR